ncbi:hypothetical protein [Ruminococcus sp. 5_1_39BFAA]|uniref:hypothetical protein n=1 Tax=Ruminococcus sp. 5_1_39BFAA TaxID=457412 RepID=UPI00356947C0
MDIKVLQYIMGHANVEITMQIYNHISDMARIENEMEKMESMVTKLLSFETSSKTIGLETRELEYENGEKALEDIMDKFSTICDLVG